MRLPVPSRLALVAITVLASSAAAQLTPLTAPKGRIRFDFVGRFDAWDRRWRDGRLEEAAAEFGGVLGRTQIPGLATAEAALGQLTGRTDLSLSLGTVTASKLVTLGTSGFGGAIGLTDRITLHGMVPIVAVRVAPRIVLDSAGGTAGFNPNGTVFGGGAAGTTGLLNSLGAAIGALQARITAGDFDGDPARKLLAEQTVARGQSGRAALTALLGPASDFAPRSGSAAAAALLQAVADLRTSFATFAVDVSGTPSLATPFLYPDYEDYLTNLDGPIVAWPIDDIPALSYLGDIEVGAAIALVDAFPASNLGRGFRAVLDATVRLRTARLDNPDRFFDEGTGDRQPDLEVTLVTDWATGRFGVRLSGGYNLQLPGNQNRRVSPIDRPLAPATSLAGIRRDPGDVIRISAQPFLRLAPQLALYGGVDAWNRQRDRVRYAAGQPPIDGVDVAVLEEGTATRGVILGLGISYSHSGVDRRGLRRFPMDASLRYERIATTSAGILPDRHSVRVDLRFYRRLFGDPNPRR